MILLNRLPHRQDKGAQPFHQPRLALRRADVHQGGQGGQQIVKEGYAALDYGGPARRILADDFVRVFAAAQYGDPQIQILRPLLRGGGAAGAAAFPLLKNPPRGFQAA